MNTETLSNGWTRTTLDDGRQRAERRTAYASLRAYGGAEPRWVVYAADDDTVLDRGTAATLDACMAAADEALTRLF